jgi:ASC-1-like (ASCH) protein
MNIKETKKNIIQAGQRAVDELIKVAKEPIVDSGDDITADRLKNAAATKKLAIFDAFEILSRIQEEENLLEGKDPKEKKEQVFKGFAEGRSK